MYACITLMKHFETKKCITRTLFSSPIQLSNDLYSNLNTLKEADNRFTDEILLLQTIPYNPNQVKHDWRVYKNEQIYAKVPQKWLHCHHFLALKKASSHLLIIWMMHEV